MNIKETYEMEERKITIAKITLNKNINNNWGKMRKLAIYNRNYAYCRDQ